MALATAIDGTRDIRLADQDPADDGGLTEEGTRERFEALTEELRELQELMFAAETHGVLVILQGMDAAGKDVTIQNVFVAANAEAIRVKHFSAMTEEEEAHDFLWRAHAEMPKRGELVIFDRSYYEQLILPIIEDETDAATTEERAHDVRAFETILGHANTLVVKVFLNVSEDEQKRRLVERMDRPETAWKISARDWIARRSWDRYMAAYETVMNATATPDAPWLVIPADRQWLHNLAVAEALIERLGSHRGGWIEARNERAKRKRGEALAETPDDVKAEF